MIYLVPSLNLAKTELFAAPQDLFPQINLLLNSVYNLQQTEVSNASFTLLNTSTLFLLIITIVVVVVVILVIFEAASQKESE